MALSAQEAAVIDQQLYVFLTGEQAAGIRSVMVAAGYSGAVAKIVDVAAELSTVMTALYHTAAPTVSP
jgi:hypothetical protein